MIVEDEPHAMLLLKDHLQKLPQMELLYSCYDANTALDFLSKQKVEVILLDINMPGMNGLEMASRLSHKQKIIFTTAYAGYAIESFDYHVIDYLLKPIVFDRFEKAIQKLQTFSLSENKNADEDFLFIKSGKQLHRIAYASIFYFKARKEYIAIQTANEKILVYKRMKEMEAILPSHFVRIHNSYIVNTRHILKSDGKQVTVNGASLPLSNSYRYSFQEKISEYIPKSDFNTFSTASNY